tara:strand:+ start:277 stop:555 length:279 start_codon:yes stop_codon:yes gene_type:complete
MKERETMAVMGPDGKIRLTSGGWWSPYGDTDKEIQENMRTGKMPNAPDAMRFGPEPGSKAEKKINRLQDFLGGIGALDGEAKRVYEERKKEN